MSTERKRDKAVGVYLEPKIVELLKIQSAIEGRSMGKIVEEAVINLLLNPTRQSATLADVDRMINTVRGKLTQITGTP